MESSSFLLNLFSTDNVALTSSLSMTASLCAKSLQFWTLQPFKPVDKPARTWRAYPTNFFYARAFCGRKNDRWWLVGLRIHSFFSPRIWIRSKLLEATDLDPDSTFACSKTFVLITMKPKKSQNLLRIYSLYEQNYILS